MEALAVFREHRSTFSERRSRVAQIPGRFKAFEPLAPGLHVLLDFGWRFLHPVGITVLKDQQKVHHRRLLPDMGMLCVFCSNDGRDGRNRTSWVAVIWASIIYRWR